MSSDLDQQQIIQSVFDENNNRLRVDAEISASIIAPPGLEVSIVATDDNIAIRNSNNSNELLINSDGSIDVNASITPNSSVNVNQIAGNTTSVNNGVANSGTLRVAIASDNSPLVVNQGTSPWVVGGTVTANAGTGTFLVDGSAHTQPVSGSLGRTWTLSSGTDSISASISNFPVTQSVTQGTSPWVVSGTITANIGTTGGLALDSTVSGLLTDAELRATPVPISGTITANAGTGNFTVVQSTATNLNATIVGTGTFAVQASQSGTWNLNNISGTISLPTGASTLTAQNTGNSTLSSILSTQTDKSQFTKITDGTDTALVTAAGELNVLATAQPGVDIGDVTVNNASGAAAVNIQDGGNSITVDGTVVTSNFPTTVDNNYGTVGSSTIRTASQIGNATGAALFGAGTTTGQVLRVVLPTDQTSIPVTATLSAETTKVIGTVNQGTSPWVNNITQFGSSNVVTGTGTSGSGIPRVTVSNDSNILATQSGVWTVQPGNTANTTAWKVDGSAVTQPISSVNQDLAQGSTTLGQVGPLIQSATTTNAPSYVTAKTNPLSSDTSGNLRVSLKDSPANTNKFLVTADPITFASPQHVILDSGTLTSITNVVHIDDNSGSLTVDNNGTFAVQSTLQAGSAIIGKVGIDQTTPGTTNKVSIGTDGTVAINTALPSGSAIIGKVGIDQTTPGTTNAVQFTNTSIAVTNAGTFATQSTLAAETTKVIGTVNIASAQTIAVTNAGTFATQSTLAAETTKVIGVTRTADGSGDLLDSTAFNSHQSLDVRTNDGFSTGANTRVAITNAGSTQLLAANTARRYAFVMNQTGKTVYLMLGAAAVVSQGILLSNNGMYEITADNLWTGTINAISNSSTSASVDVFEGTI